jgi:hypothetical protein
MRRRLYITYMSFKTDGVGGEGRRERKEAAEEKGGENQKEVRKEGT